MIDFEEYQEHEVCELICLKCMNRWIGVFPTKTLLKNLECKCGEVGCVIKTGQTIQEEKQCLSCRHYNGRCKLEITCNKDRWCEFYLKGETE